MSEAVMVVDQLDHERDEVANMSPSLISSPPPPPIYCSLVRNQYNTWIHGNGNGRAAKNEEGLGTPVM